MSSFSSLSPELQGVVIAGLFSLVLIIGTGFGWWVRYKVLAKARRNDLTRLKLEHALNELLAIDGWIENQLDRLIAGHQTAFHNPGQRVLALIRAYAPELNEPAQHVHQALLEWSTACGQLKVGMSRDDIEAVISESTKQVFEQKEKLSRTVTTEIQALRG